MPSNKKLLQAAAGNAGESLYVEDVFSTYLYDGVGGTPTINNGIDLLGEGGLAWFKNRGAGNHFLYDTARGAGNSLVTSTTSAQGANTGLTAFGSTGFTLGNTSLTNGVGDTYASWSFRKSEKFFDIQTWTGNGVAGRTVAHNLGSTPAVIIVKATSISSNWAMYHTSLGNTKYMQINNYYGAGITDSTFWNNTSPTDSVFTLGTSSVVNQSGVSYVAYIYASDAGGFGDDGTENIIKCGTFNSGSSGFSVDLGFEPQWILIKDLGGNQYTAIYDTMRGWVTFGNPNGNKHLYPSTSGAEGSYTTCGVESTGFKWQQYANTDYIYIAIRRPMKTPESGTEVFKPNDVDNGASSPDSISGFPVDMYFRRYVNTTNDTYLLTRLTSPNALKTNGTDAEAAFSSSSAGFDYQNGVMNIFSSDNSDFHTWMFKRATGFFDVVAYTGTGAVRTIPHNLGVAPEMMLFKIRNQVSNWQVYASGMGPTKSNRLNNNGAPVTATAFFNDTAPTSSVFTVGTSGNVNWSGNTVIAYLFATLAGVSKVGSYTGTGTHDTHVIDCGFSNGARFVLLKRTDASSDWFLWDSERGITNGADPRLSLNSTAAEYNGLDDIRPHPSGFIAANPNGSDVNASGSEWIFLAIA